MEFNFDEIFEEVLKRRQKAYERRMQTYQRPINTVKPSSIGECVRKQYFDDAGMGLSPDVDLLKIFAHGNLIHDDFVFPIIEEYLKHKKNIVVLNEYPLLYEHPYKDTVLHIKGYIDDLILKTDKNGATFIPIEAKSISDRFWQLKEPDYIHQIQLQMYMHVLNADVGYILYVHKSSLSSKTFKLERSIDTFNLIMERAEQLYDWKKEGTIPPAEAMINKDDYWFKKKCDYCPYLEFCKSQSQGEIKSE